MLGLLLFFSTWLGASVALGSITSGMGTAASIAIWWSVGTSIITTLAGIAIIGLGTIKNGLEGLLKMGVSVIMSLILWSATGIGAAVCLATGSPFWIAIGIFLWLISLVSQTVSVISFPKAINRL